MALPVDLLKVAEKGSSLNQVEFDANYDAIQAAINELHAEQQAKLDQGVKTTSSPAFAGLTVAGKTLAAREAALARSIGGEAYRDLLGLPSPSLDISRRTPRDANNVPLGTTFSRAVTATYWGPDGLLKTAPIGWLRDLWDPVTGEWCGFFVEPARTNIALYSQDLDNAYWSKARLSVTANAGVAPDGTATADKLVEDTTASNTHALLRTLTVTANTVYTCSAFLAAAGRTRAMFRFYDGSDSITGFIDLTAGTITVNSAGAATQAAARIKRCPGGYFRVSITGLVNATSTSMVLQLNLLDAQGNSAYSGDGASGMYVWGMQVEAGAEPTSYIPTTSATVTRSRDIWQPSDMTWFNKNGFTVLTEYSKPEVGARCRLWWLSDGTLGRFHTAYVDPAAPTVAAMQMGTDGGGFRSLTANAYGTVHVATFSSTDVTAASLDGASATTVSKQGAAVASAVPMTSLSIGGRHDGQEMLNGCIKRLVVFPATLTQDQCNKAALKAA